MSNKKGRRRVFTRRKRHKSDNAAGFKDSDKEIPLQNVAENSPETAGAALLTEHQDSSSHHVSGSHSDSTTVGSVPDTFCCQENLSGIEVLCNDSSESILQQPLDVQQPNLADNLSSHDTSAAEVLIDSSTKKVHQHDHCYALSSDARKSPLRIPSNSEGIRIPVDVDVKCIETTKVDLEISTEAHLTENAASCGASTNSILQNPGDNSPSHEHVHYDHCYALSSGAKNTQHQTPSNEEAVPIIEVDDKIINTSKDSTEAHLSENVAMCGATSVSILQEPIDVQPPISTNLPSSLTATEALTQELKQCPVMEKFNEVAQQLKKHLPPLWHVILENNALNILKFSPGGALLPQRSIVIGREGIIQYYVHGQLLPQDHELYSFKRSLKTDSVMEMLSSIRNTIDNFRLQEICCGVPQVKFRKFWNRTANSTVDKNIFGETRYQETCRSTSCSLLITQSRRMCLKCLHLSKNLSLREKSTAGRTGTPSKYKPYKALITPEKNARDKKKSKEILRIRKENKRLRDRIDKLIQEEGIDIGADTDKDLRAILNAAVADPKTSAMKKIFIEQQLEACSLKDSRSMRWHPMMIRLALRIRMLSRPAYNELRESGLLVLPSDRTLHDYSHVIDVKPGLCIPIIEDVAKTVQSFENDYQGFHTLMFDEVYIKEKLVQNKHTGEVIGYAHITEVEEEFEQLDRMVRATAEGTQVAEPKGPPVAKKILSYLVKGTASSVSSVVASYPVCSLSKENLYEYTWEVTEALEARGIMVVCFVCDGSAVNRGFFDMHPQAEEEDEDEDMIEECDLGPSDVVTCTVNMYAPERIIYFFSDLPHLVKTMRNGLYNSGKKKCRKLFKNGEYMTWSTIVGLFNEKKDQTLKKLHKLTAACVYLNSYSRMNCLYAFRVFSASVSNCILQKNIPGTRELGLFAKN